MHMKLQKAVVDETRRVAVGSAILTVVMLIVFAVIKRFDYTVILGALLGYVTAVGNFLWMAMTVQKAAEPQAGETDEEREGRIRRTVKLSYTQRRLFQAVMIVIALIVPVFHWVAALIELVFPTMTIYARQLLLKKRETERTDKPNG